MLGEIEDAPNITQLLKKPGDAVRGRVETRKHRAKGCRGVGRRGDGFDILPSFDQSILSFVKSNSVPNKDIQVIEVNIRESHYRYMA